MQKSMINYNMRCIETVLVIRVKSPEQKINYNMRCIETVALWAVKVLLGDKLQHEMY